MYNYTNYQIQFSNNNSSGIMYVLIQNYYIHLVRVALWKHLLINTNFIHDLKTALTPSSVFMTTPDYATY